MTPLMKSLKKALSPRLLDLKTGAINLRPNCGQKLMNVGKGMKRLRQDSTKVLWKGQNLLLCATKDKLQKDYSQT